MENSQIIQILTMSGLFIGMGIAFYGFYLWNLVKKSIGWKMVKSLGRVKLGLGGQDLTLRIKSLAGRESYLPIKQSPVIEYEYLENGKKVKKYVIYDERAVDYLNGIPILNVSPNDIRPIDRETGLLVNIPSEIIDKLAVDSSKTAENEALNNKTIKMLIYALIGMAILFIIALSYINQTNMDLQATLARVTAESIKSATVIVG